MSTIPESVREFVAGGLWAHVVTMNRQRRAARQPVLGWLRRRRDRLRVVLRRQAGCPPQARPARHALLPGEGVRRWRAVSLPGGQRPRERRRRRGARGDGPPRPVVHRSGHHVPGSRHAVGLDLPGRHRQDLRPRPVERSMGRRWIRREPRITGAIARPFRFGVSTARQARATNGSRLPERSRETSAIRPC